MSNVVASKLVFGTVSLGLAYGLPRVGASAVAPLDDEAVSELVEHALARGIAVFDTAPAYGTSEVRLGRALRGRGRVWTKVAGGDPGVSLERSLRHLERDRVELLQWHNWTDALGHDPGWRAAWMALRDDPRVAKLGATTYGAADAVAAARSGLFDVVQVEYNLLNQGVVAALEPEDRAIDVAVRSVYLQGALTDDGRALPELPTLREGLARAREVAGEAGLTRLALASAVEHPRITHVLLGFDRVEQIDLAIEAVGRSHPACRTERAVSLDLRGDPAADPRTWPVR